MEENNEVLETTAEEVSEEDSSAFDEVWGEDNADDDDFDLTEDETPDDSAEDAQPEPESESEESEAETEEQGVESEEGNQLFEINYLGNKEKLTLKQMTELAQKGRDYDHVRQERDSLKSESGRQLAFLKDLADRAGVTVDEQIDRTRALWLMNEEYDKGNEISEEEALKRIKEQNSKQAKEETASDVPEGFDEQITRFLKVYPDVKGDDIPQEVWAKTKEMGGDLLGAYQWWEIKSLKEEKASRQKEDNNKKNERRSTGSLNSAGSSRKKDDFDMGWDSL